MKVMKWIVWTLIGLAAVLFLLGSIFLVFNINPFGIRHIESFLQPADTLLLFAVALYVVTDKLSGWCKGHKE